MGDQGGEKKAEETDGSPPPAPSPSPGAWISAQAQRSAENNGTPVPGSYGNRRGSCFFIAPFSSLCSPFSVFPKHVREVSTWKATFPALLKTLLEAIIRENERLSLELKIDKRI